jgi:hypothetical protein
MHRYTLGPNMTPQERADNRTRRAAAERAETALAVENARGTHAALSDAERDARDAERARLRGMFTL